MENTKKNGLNIQWPITIATLAILFILVGFIALKPDEATEGIGTVFNAVMSATSPFMLLTNTFFIFAVFILAFSKFGRIKLGEGKPEYSMFSYIAMMACAALASASMFWSFTEWAYYNLTPGLDIAPMSYDALKESMAYAFFHWGFWAQATYVVVGLITAYAIYVRKMGTTRLSVIAEEMMGGFKGKKIVGRIIDLIVTFCTLAGLGVSLGLGIPVIAGGISHVTGLNVSFPMQVVIVIVLAAIFSWSSFVGTGRGMKFLSDNTVKLLFVLLIFICVAGPFEFIQKLFAQSVGLMFSDFFEMATFADPINNGGFAEGWTVFFFAFPLSYAGLMGVFVAKISRGRSIKTLVLACMLGISIGTWLFFAVDGGLAMHSYLTGKFDMIAEVENGDPYWGVFQVLDTLPLSRVSGLVYTVCVAGFICTTLDAASLALASTTTKVLDGDFNPAKSLRLFWCLMLTLTPLAMMFSGANFNVMKNLAILVGVPIAVVLLLMFFGLFRWMREDKEKSGFLLFTKSTSDDMISRGKIDDLTDYGPAPYELKKAERQAKKEAK